MRVLRSVNIMSEWKLISGFFVCVASVGWCTWWKFAHFLSTDLLKLINYQVN